MLAAESRTIEPVNTQFGASAPTDAGRAAMVARAGFEPATFHFSGERCYQLSYLAMDPEAVTVRTDACTALATPTGLEPATSAVTGRRANQLRYGAW